jgi:hypothetical protein
VTDEPSTYSLAILRALNLRALSGTHVYDGRTPEHVVARRRARNRMARASRRINRR